MNAIITQNPTAVKDTARRRARVARLIRKAERLHAYFDSVGLSYTATQRAWHGKGSDQHRAAEAMWRRMVGVEDRRLRVLWAEAARLAEGDEPAAVEAQDGPSEADRAFWAAEQDGGCVAGEASPWDRTLGACETLWDIRNREARVER